MQKPYEAFRAGTRIPFDGGTVVIQDNEANEGCVGCIVSQKIPNDPSGRSSVSMCSNFLDPIFFMTVPANDAGRFSRGCQIRAIQEGKESLIENHDSTPFTPQQYIAAFAEHAERIFPGKGSVYCRMLAISSEGE